MLFQPHHQFKNHTEMKMQVNAETNDELSDYLEEAEKKYPIPKGALWMVCTEDSPLFVKTVAQRSENGEERLRDD